MRSCIVIMVWVFFMTCLAAVGLLLEPAVVLGDSTLADSPPDNSFLWFSRHSSRLHLEPTEGYRLPSRIQQVDSVTVRGRGKLDPC